MDEQRPPDDPTPGTSPPAIPPVDAPPPPPPPAQPQVVYVAQQQAPNNGMATASLVLGIISVVMFWAVGLGAILGILAIVFGVIGISKAKTGAPNKGLAVAGLVLGIIGLLASVMIIFAINQIGSDTEGVFDEISNQIEFCLDHPNDPAC